MVEDSVVEAMVERALYRGPAVTEDQLVGLDSCLRQLGGQFALIARPELAERFGLQASGTLLLGPPGTGKTLTATLIATRAGLPLYAISADEFAGDPDLLHRVFRRLSSERAVLFIDEISILAQRREYSDAGDRRMLSALLTSLDGVAGAGASGSLWVIGAATQDIRLDPAIHRSGRLGVVIEYAAPSQEHRRELLDLMLRGVPHEVAPEDLDRLAEISVGATGADIKDWTSQAASEALYDAGDEDPVIRYAQLERVVARRGFVPAEDRPGREPGIEVATHESAHAVLALALFGRDALAQAHVGWSGSNRALGFLSAGHFTLSDDWADANGPSSATWRDHAVLALAGACAEEEVLGWSRGAQSDVARCTEVILARLDEGDTDFGPSRSVVESPTGMGSHDGSDDMRQRVWELSRARFEECRERASGLVRLHRPAIERLARHLIENKSTLTGDEIVAAIGPLGEA